MSIPPELLLLYVVTTGVGVAMIKQGLRVGRLKLRRPDRCVACGRTLRPSARCRCFGE